MTMRRIANYAKTRLRQWIEDAVRRNIEPFGDSYWYSAPNFWEPPVQIALKDLCRPGTTVFDVGANFGGLTSVMSRMVGPLGIVCSFEASPRIFPHLQSNIVKQGHNNVTAYHCAVYARSNERIKIYPGDHLNDSIYDYGHGRPGEFSWVNTVSLDDFCTTTGLVPAVLKMDIEGAEFDALSGASRLIEDHRPHLILEQQPSDTRCLDLLKQHGYVAMDLNAYKLIDSAADFPANVQIRNLLFVHTSRTQDVPYQLPPRLERVAAIEAPMFLRAGRNFSCRVPDKLKPGRYIVDLDIAASGTSNELMCGVKIDGQTVFRYHGYSKLIADSYRDWVIDVLRESTIEMYFDFVGGTFDDSLALSGARISQVAQFQPDVTRQFAMP